MESPDLGEEEQELPPLEIEKPPAFPWLLVGSVILLTVLAMIVYQKYLRDMIWGKPDAFYEALGAGKLTRYQLHPNTAQYKKFIAEYDGDDLDQVKRALFQRALCNLQLVFHMQKEAQGMGSLYKRGMIGEAVWRNFKSMEEMVKQEMDEVRYEADRVLPGWGQAIWMQAAEAANKQRQEQAKKVCMLFAH
ncbi:unnamed protein product [Chrysoparadoxa australica]